MHRIIGQDSEQLPQERAGFSVWLWQEGGLAEAPIVAWSGDEPQIFDAARGLNVGASQHPDFVAVIQGTPRQNVVAIAGGIHLRAGEEATALWLRECHADV